MVQNRPKRARLATAKQSCVAICPSLVLLGGKTFPDNLPESIRLVHLFSFSVPCVRLCVIGNQRTNASRLDAFFKGQNSKLPEHATGMLLTCVPGWRWPCSIVNKVTEYPKSLRGPLRTLLFFKCQNSKLPEDATGRCSQLPAPCPEVAKYSSSTVNKMTDYPTSLRGPFRTLLLLLLFSSFPLFYLS